jgi:hypothetical protein
MNLKIHLVESFLHMQDVFCRHLDQAAAMSHNVESRKSLLAAGSWCVTIPPNANTGATGNRSRRFFDQVHFSHAVR